MKSWKAVFKVFFSINFWKSACFRKIILFWFFLLAALIAIPYLYINEQASFNAFLGNKLPSKDFLNSRKIILEFGPWIVVILTSFFILSINTLTYFFIYIYNLKKSKKLNNKANFYYDVTTVAILFCFFTFLTLMVYLYSVYRDFFDIIGRALAAPYKTGVISRDTNLLHELTQNFKVFVSKTEIITIIIFILFIIMDSFQFFAKSIQIEDEKDDKTKASLLLERKINLQQIWLIDVPVLCGIILIKIFSSKIDITNLYSYAYYLFPSCFPRLKHFLLF